MSTQKVRKFGAALAVPALLTAGLLAAQGAPASAPTPRAACDGVRLLTAPYVAIGIGDLTIDVSGPLDDVVICQPVNVGRPGQPHRAQSVRTRRSRVPGSSHASPPRRPAA